MQDYLQPIVDAYLKYFPKSRHPHIWEVGSRDGKDAFELAAALSSASPEEARVVAFEPNPTQALLIKENFPSFDVRQVAASNKDGQAKFMVYEGDEGAVGSSSLHLRWKEDDLKGHIIKVRTIRLYGAVPPRVKLDVMKIDVEGHSLQVLEGLGERLNNIRVLHVETEDWTKSDQKVKYFLQERGWRLEDERQQWSGMPDQTWVNAALIPE